MPRLTRPVLATLLTLAVALGVARPAAAGPLEAFPRDTATVVRLSSVDKFLGNANDMLAAIGATARKAGPFVERVLREDVLELASLDAVDRKAPIYVAAFPLSPEKGPPVAWLLKATDEAKLYRQLMRVKDLKTVERIKRADGFTGLHTEGRACYVARRDGSYLYTFNEDVLRRLAFDAGKQPTFAKVLDANAKKEFESGDLAVAVHVSYLATTYKPQIEAARKQTDEIIKSLSDEDLGVPNAEAAKKLYRAGAMAAFDSVYDATTAVASVSLGPAGGGASLLVGFKKGSKTDAVLAANPAALLENLELLPRGAPMYFGLKMNYEGVGEALLLTNYGGAPEDRQALEAALKLMKQAGVQSNVSTLTIPRDAKDGMVATTVEEAKDVAKLRRGWADYLKALGEVNAPLIKQKFEYRAGAEKHKAHAIDVLKTSFKLDVDDAEAEKILEGFFGRLFGGMSIETRLATVDNLLIQTTGNHPRFIQRVLDSLDSGEGVLGLEKAYGKTRDRLNKKANLLVLVNAPQTVIDSVQMIKSIEPFGTLLGLAPFNFSLKPPASYGGVSVSAEPQAVRLKVFIPSEQPRGILQIFMPGA